uniref:Uncharacterized protein n=1 Tax=Arundo donax TaxID=35708 RepID=A0A0A8YL51_ARUDO
MQLANTHLRFVPQLPEPINSSRGVWSKCQSTTKYLDSLLVTIIDIP